MMPPLLTSLLGGQKAKEGPLDFQPAESRTMALPPSQGKQVTVAL
jgi:hypothetical protein